VTGAESPDDSWYSRAITDFIQEQLGIEGWLGAEFLARQTAFILGNLLQATRSSADLGRLWSVRLLAAPTGASRPKRKCRTSWSRP
jgi:hypothetical protein